MTRPRQSSKKGIIVELLEVERSVSFDPAGTEADFTTLQSLLRE